MGKNTGDTNVYPKIKNKKRKRQKLMLWFAVLERDCKHLFIYVF